MTKEKPIYLDKLGQPLEEGNYVAVCHHNDLYICQITRINPKMLRVKPIQGRYRDGFLKYSNQCVLLGGPDATAYILRNAEQA